MIKVLNFKVIFYSYLIVSVLSSVTSYATQHDYQIEIYDTGQEQRFVNSQGYIEDQYKERLKYLVDVSLNTESWKDFKQDLKDRQTRSMVAENAAQIFFDSFNYKIYDKNYIERMERLKAPKNTLPLYSQFFMPLQPNFKKGIDNGIDGIYLLKEESPSNLTHIIINEAKFRDKLNLSTLDFGTTYFAMDRVEQSHSIWNRDHFNTFLSDSFQYDEIKVIRTATLLNRDGTLKLYEIRDKTGPDNYYNDFPHYKFYPSEWNTSFIESSALKKLLNI